MLGIASIGRLGKHQIKPRSKRGSTQNPRNAKSSSSSRAGSKKETESKKILVGELRDLYRKSFSTEPNQNSNYSRLIDLISQFFSNPRVMKAFQERFQREAHASRNLFRDSFFEKICDSLKTANAKWLVRLLQLGTGSYAMDRFQDYSSPFLFINLTEVNTTHPSIQGVLEDFWVIFSDLVYPKKSDRPKKSIHDLLREASFVGEKIRLILSRKNVVPHRETLINLRWQVRSLQQEIQKWQNFILEAIERFNSPED